MKDLKHIHTFTKLLDEVNNDLVQQAAGEGRIPLGYTCYFIPEVLLNVDKGFSVRLRTPNMGSLDISTYYMSNYVCEYSRAIVERGIEGGYNFLGALIASETCTEMHRAAEHFDLLDIVPNEKFFVSILDAPFKTDDHCVEHFVNQIRNKIIKPLSETYGIDYSDDKMREAVEKHNEVCRILTEIGEFRKEPCPRITGTEYHVLNLVSYTCPKALIVDMLQETLEEIRDRQPDSAGTYRARVVMVGSEIDDYEFTQLIEQNGALVVADRFCFGAIPGREPIVLPEDGDVLTSIVRYYLEASQCPRFMSREKVDGRKELIRRLVKDYSADGVIYEQLKFCEYWGYERALSFHILTEEFGIPTLSVDRQYTVRTGTGQLRTRVQAFVESLEIKKIHGKRG